MTRLVWFRNDLRIHDNPALSFARRDDAEATVAVVFAPATQWQKHGLGPRRINLYRQAIMNLQAELQNLGIPLLIAPGDTFAECLTQLQSLLEEFAFSEVDFNIEYEINERQRDVRLSRWAAERHIHVNKFHDQCLIPPGEVLTGDGQMYKVFTPFKKAWLNAQANHCEAPCAAPAPQAIESISQNILNAWQSLGVELTATLDDLWQADENSGHDQLQAFLDRDVLYYKEQRDFPDVDATSRLSFYLALGILSPRQCIYTAWQKNHCMLSGGETGIDTWISELVWREFYRHLIVAWPDLCKHQPFKAETNAVQWRDSDADFQRWCDGKTGYPIVDAAMKQLLDQGWMHNRLRMIVAMFLTKHLLIDWRRGEAFFNYHLVDADFSANNGGWQWSASTGADGAPYFRIFNPTTQSENFDPQGNFLARYLPELNSIPVKQRHNPSPEQRRRCQYPDPVVEHKSARQRALDAFRQTSESQAG